METILYLAHTQTDGTLSKAALETLGAALELSQNLGGAPLTIGLIGGDVQAAADAIATCGAGRFLAVEGPDFATSRYRSDTTACESIAGVAQASIIIAAATSRFNRALPGVAHRLEGRIDTRVSALQTADGKPEIERWYYRQRMLAKLSREQRPWVMLLDSGIAEPWTGSAGSATLERLSVELSDSQKRTTVLGLEAPTTDTQTIRPDSELLFVAGAGWTKKQADGQTHTAEAEELIKGFLDTTQASLGSSKSLVDQNSEGQATISFMSHLNQVGQTGATPRHSKGLATCCHGEEPHVIGWRFINERRAINTDPACGWAQGKTDVLYVADAFEVMEKVNELLNK